MPYAAEWIAIFARMKSRLVGVSILDVTWNEPAGELILSLSNGKFLQVTIDKVRRATEEPN